MRVNFVTEAGESAASFRYRIMTPARELMCRGHDTSIGEFDPDADVVVFSKHWDETHYDKALSFKGKKVFDICDWHVGNKEVHEHYLKMILVCDMITVSTREIQKYLKCEGIESVYIPDCYLLDEADAKYAPEDNERIKLLWYGHDRNIDALKRIMPTLSGNYILVLTSEKGMTKIGIESHLWSLPKMLQCMETCDAVVIPQNLDFSYYLAKGANRLIEAVRRGKFVFAHSVPSYREFDEWMWIGDIRHGIDWAKRHPDEIVGRIKGCQQYIRDNYPPHRIGKMWEDALCR